MHRTTGYMKHARPYMVCHARRTMTIGKVSLTSTIVINVPTRASLAVETKGYVSVVGTRKFVNRYLPYSMVD